MRTRHLTSAALHDVSALWALHCREWADVRWLTPPAGDVSARPGLQLISIPGNQRGRLRIRPSGTRPH